MAKTTKWMVLSALALALCGPLVAGDAPEADASAKTDEDKAETKRAKIDAAAKETLDQLFAEAPDAKKIYDKAVGYAVFSNLKVAVGISGGGGSGVAVKKAGDARTYMKMGTGGVGLGLGSQKYRVVFLFENDEVLKNFIEKGWQADASAQAAAGTAGANATTTFRNGLAIYQFSDKGLMASADVSGTKYWKAENLN